MRPERVTLLVSSLLVALFTGFLLYSWLARQKEQGPPHPVVRLGAIRVEPDGFCVPFTVTNEGEQTAEEVEVQAALGGEQGEQRVDYLAQGEEVQGAFLFQHDPRQGNLTVRVASYKLP